MWFDEGELTTLLGSKADKNFVIHKHSMKLQNNNCPRCDVALYEFCYPGTVVLVDGCKQCSGVWLDNNEWKAISHARDVSKNINCPKCHTNQKPADACSKCGIVFAKYEAENQEQNSDSSKANLNTENSIDEQSYADDIPGLKGSFLRSIDREIRRLTSRIF